MGETQKSMVCEKNTMGRIGDRPYWVLNLSILIRAVHQVGASVFLALEKFPYELIPTFQTPHQIYAGRVRNRLPPPGLTSIFIYSGIRSYLSTNSDNCHPHP